MRRKSPSAESERGSAPLEFIGVGVILLVPLVYLILALGAVQQQTLGAEAAARHTARAIAQAPNAAAARTRADAILTSVMREYRMPRDGVSITMSCSTAKCPAPGATLRVTVTSRVTLPFMPPILGLDTLATIPIRAEAIQKVSGLWGD